LRQIEATSIADDLKIRNVFRLDRWTVEEGIDFLQGVFLEYDLGDGATELLMLDGRRYSNAEYEPEINEINLRYKLLKEIWDRTNRKRESYSPRIFIDWGMKHRDLAKIAWFDDARARGLLDDIQKSQKKLATEDDQKPLNAKEKSSLLKIIAGLSKLCYGDFRRGLKAEVVEDFEKLAKDYPELKIDKDILRNNFNEAWKKYLPNEIEKN